MNSRSLPFFLLLHFLSVAFTKAQPTTWDSTTTYSIGDIVVSGDASYIATSSNNNHQPPNVNYWTDLSTAAEAIGVPSETVPSLDTPTILTALSEISSDNAITGLNTVGSYLYFNAKNGIWKSDGTDGGTTLIKDGLTGTGFMKFGDWVYFSATDDNGTELWRTNGTENNAQIFKDLFPGSSSYVGQPMINSSNPSSFFVYKNLLYFSADEGLGHELWVTDGTLNGSKMLKDIFPGNNFSSIWYVANSSSPRNFRIEDGDLYFLANDENGTSLWTTNGTSESTVKVHAFKSFSSGKAVRLNESYFYQGQNILGAELWKTEIPQKPEISSSSVRSFISHGGGELFYGFTIEYGEMLVLIKGLGPSLANMGISNSLTDTRLSLYDSSGNIIAESDNWDTSAEANEISDLGEAPSSSLESAILLTLSPGSYNIILQSANESSGLGILELKNLNVSAKSKLRGVSVRGLMTASEDYYHGLSIVGSEPISLLSTALGSHSLQNSGIVNAISDPTLSLFQKGDNGFDLIAENDNWQDNLNSSQIYTSGYADIGKNESALLQSLDSGIYSFTISNAGGNSGSFLHQIYDMANFEVEPSGLGEDWKKENWFGSYYQSDSPWIYHSSLHWLYIVGEISSTDFWFYSEDLGWMWSGSSYYPNVYSIADQKWNYLTTNSGGVKPSLWNPVLSYSKDDLVIYENISYIALSSNTNQQPTNSTYWQSLKDISHSLNEIDEESIPTFNRSFNQSLLVELLNNASPTDLRTVSTLAIVENQPTSSIIGELNATDPEGGVLTYSLVSGQGDENNQFFMLDTNGTLKIERSFDYETEALTYSIRVQAKDEYNASVQSSFIVHLMDDVTDNIEATYTVSGGQSGSPYYNLTDANGNTPDFNNTTKLFKGKNYEFIAFGVSGTHPFMIGESYGDTSSVHVTGGPFNSSSDGSKITLSIPFDYSGDFYFYCTAHSGMYQKFQIGTVNHIPDLNSTVTMDMTWVDAGTFTMGSPTTEPSRGTDETEHNVSISKGFYLGKYEVTQAQYEAVMTGVSGDLNATPSNWADNSNRPVERVSYDDIQVFLTRLNAQQSTRIPTGWSYVLPTESEWEYACRAGTTTIYSWGDDINSTLANYYASSIAETVNVGQYPANSWGFFDMLGNVAEWTEDWYQDAYPTGTPEVDPSGPLTGFNRTKRGGSWNAGITGLRIAARTSNTTDTSNANIGFRVALKKTVQTNQSPTDLNSTSALTMVENAALQTVIGEFNATDPDGGTLTYYLISGAGDGNNSLFLLDTNGTLKTEATFDYESNASTYSIRVQAKDDQDDIVEGVFTVHLIDDTTDNIEATYMVSGGQTDAPYYIFEDTKGVVPDFTTLQLIKGKNYEFVASGVSDDHPFMIGESYEDSSSAHVTGGPFNSSSDGSKITLSIPFDYTGEFYFYCQNHQVMVQQFQIASDHVVELDSPVNLEMIWVEPGTFVMGSPLGEDRRDDEAEHNVTLSKGFYLGKYEVTQAQYEAVMSGIAESDLNSTPSEFHGNPNQPVENVSWDDVQVFLKRLNAQQSGNIPSGWKYVLPTEAQWEYSCRAGTTTVYSLGDPDYSWSNPYLPLRLTDANFKSVHYGYLDKDQPVDVGEYLPNPWGFFDMHGNVAEWVADAYGGNYSTDSVVDPININNLNSDLFCIRGGSWFYFLTYLRSAARDKEPKDARYNDIGFRVCLQLQ